MYCWHQLPRVLSRRGRSLGLRPPDPLNIRPIAILQLSIIVNSKAIATGTKRYGYSRNQSYAWEIIYKCNTRIPNDRLMTDTAGFKFTNFISRKSVYPYICDLASWNFNHYFCVGLKHNTADFSVMIFQLIPIEGCMHGSVNQPSLMENVWIFHWWRIP